MRRDLIVAGIVGLLVGMIIYLGASALSTQIPILVQDPFGIIIVFAFALVLSLFEIPMMVFGLRQIARSSVSHLFFAGLFGLFVGFASVYASMFILLTGSEILGLGLASLCAVRFLTGLFIS
jgi:hypothetical protein